MKSKIFALSVVLACSSAVAQSKAKSADDNMYVELGYSSGQYNIDAFQGMSNANHLLITLGKNMSKDYALEGVYANGMSDSSSADKTVNVRLASSYGLYVKPKMAISDAFELFARVGYFNYKANSTVPSDATQNSSASGTSLSYGLGASMKIANNIYGNLDWMQMYKKEGTDIKSMGLSVGYKF
jgi:hypothetical protein